MGQHQPNPEFLHSNSTFVSRLYRINTYKLILLYYIHTRYLLVIYSISTSLLFSFDRELANGTMQYTALVVDINIVVTLDYKMY